MAEVAAEFEARAFVLVSTDKAVNPTNVLGQTKLVCEWIVHSSALDEGTTTRFLAVRFGNVLASSGSVIPLFRRQIARGGPVTVTHPRDDPVLHDDPGGCAADRPGRRDRRVG